MPQLSGFNWANGRNMALGFGLLVCYWPGTIGWAIPTGWPFLSITMPWLARPKLYPILAWVALGLLWTPIFQQGMYDVWKLAICSAVFTLGLNSNNSSRSVFVGLGLGMGVSSTIAVAQLFGWQGVFFATTVPLVPAGLFVNPDMMGETAALIAVYLLIAGPRWPLVGVLPAVYLSHSRLALLALAAGCLAWLWDRSRWLAIVVIIAVPVVAMIQHKTLEDSISPRLGVWGDTIDGLTLLGRGPGSFIIEYPAFASRTDTMDTRPEDAHNDFLQLAFEYGIGATLLVPVLLVGLVAPGPERFVLIAWCCIAFFSFPLAIPSEAFIGAFVLGRAWGMDGAHRHVRRLAYEFWAPIWESLPSPARRFVVSLASYGPGLSRLPSQLRGLVQPRGTRRAEAIDRL